MKKLPLNMPVEQRDRITHEVPKKWAATFMKLTGSNVIIHGKENIPDGPVVFICNHEGNFDIPVLLGFIEKPFGFISKIEVKKIPLLSTWMEVINCVFLDRKDRRQAIASIREGVALLKKGHSIVIFPEGTRSKGGPVGEFKTGSFRLAKDAAVPIVPISIRGTSDVFEKNGLSIKPADIHVVIGKAVEPKSFKEQDLKELANEVREVVISNLNDNKKAS